MNIIIKILYQASKLLLQLFRPMTMGVRILMIRDDQILLVKHVYEDRWYLPGGLVEKGETLDFAARREASEEVGATIHDLTLYGVFSSFNERRNDHIMVFETYDFDLNGTSDHEIERVEFFPLKKVPTNTSPGSQNRINDYLNNRKDRFGTW
jgi:8-oxo-dGTP pyrophosphatase MutT (NUDIX family)